MRDDLNRPAGVPTARDERGFTLPEMLIACAMTLVVVGGAVTALRDGMRLSTTSRVVADANQSLQAAMSLMVRDFIQTGQGLPTGGIPIPSGPNAAPIVRPGPPGAAIAFPATWTALPSVSPGDGLGPNLLGVQTDLVTVLYADPTIALNQYSLAAIANDGSSMTVDARTSITGADGLRAGDLILFSNALGNALQTVTSTDGAQHVFFAPGDPLNLNQRGATQGTILNLQSSPTSYPPTTATRVVMVSYYLDAVTDPSLPRLIRQLANGPRLAIALGAENLQITFDLVDGLTNPTNVSAPAPPFSPNQIRKANLYLAGRSQDTDPRTGHVYRNATATEVDLRSLSFVDRYK